MLQNEEYPFTADDRTYLCVRIYSDLTLSIVLPLIPKFFLE